MSKLDNNPVDRPAHYNSHKSGIEAIVITEQLGFNLGNAFKYVFRHENKWNPVEDLKKALWYLNREQFRLAPWLWGASVSLSCDQLSGAWEYDLKVLNPDTIIYKVIGTEHGDAEKALFYIWAAQFSFGMIFAPIEKAKWYISRIIDQRQNGEV